jgi:hypothetical protein
MSEFCSFGGYYEQEKGENRVENCGFYAVNLVVFSGFWMAFTRIFVH